MKKLFFFLSVFTTCFFVHAQKYEAELSSYSGTHTTTDVTGASGSCIRFENEGEYVRVTANVSTAGTYKIYVAYASPYGEKIGNVSINGSGKSVAFSETSSCTELYIGDYTLSSGNNTIEVTPDWTWFYIDYIRIDGGDDGGGTIPSGKGFYVSGSKLLDANGKEFIMRGVNMAWTWYQNTGMAQLEAIARAGANTVRIVLSANASSSYYGADTEATVSSLIAKCESLEMVAVLEVHDFTGSDNASDLLTAANFFAGVKNALIGKESTVIINIANEWYGSWNSTAWKNGYVSAIPVIRNAGLEHCIMVDAGGWGQHTASVHDMGTTVLNADPNKNVMFSIHMYQYSGTSSNVKSNIDGVINQNLALCIGEFGWYHSGDVDEDLILSYCNEKSVGWLAWSWYGNGGDVEYLDMVKTPGNESSYYTASSSSYSCDWGKKIIDAWKSEAVTCSVFTEGITTVDDAVKMNAATVYPTKITDAVNVLSAETGGTIFVANALGQVIAIVPIKENTTVLPCDSWQPGMYFISINKQTFKVLK